jgi:protein-S-isoprenylcysteine O-methyltransferase Ste14
MFKPHPISFVQLDTLWAMTALLIAAVAWAALRKVDRPEGSSRRLLSSLGIALQAAGFAIAAIGFMKTGLPWWAPYSLVSTILVILLGGSAIALFVSAVSAMGKNWSLIARTRSDHRLVRSGPFAMVRHPIYLALMLYLFSMAAALGHWQQLLFAVPLYLAGTLVRIREEEALLGAQFGDDHARYVREVPALIPLVI